MSKAETAIRQLGPWRMAGLAALALALAALILARPFRDGTPPVTPSPLAPGATPTAVAAETEAQAAARRQMVEWQIRDRGVSDAAVLEAMETVPRHLFVPSDSLGEAYADHPLPIGFGQTISQPYVVACMTELLRAQPGDKVLEIGTGSGYQAAILAQMGVKVFTIEIVEALAIEAAARLAGMGYQAVSVRHGDGYYGWEEQAPFDAIVVTCAPDHIPQPLVSQLADGGRMVLPVGPPGGYQSLWLVEKVGEEVRTSNQGGVRFVPLTGDH